MQRDGSWPAHGHWTPSYLSVLLKLSERGKFDDRESKSFSLCVVIPVRSWWRRWWVVVVLLLLLWSG